MEKSAGTKLSVREAIDYTLKLSDNTAAGVLAQALPDGALIDVFDQLDLPKTRTGPFPVMSPKSYSSVFRNLYLSSYLEYEHSNRILELLTQSRFSDKLPAGVATGIPVSHKIGVFQVSKTDAVYGDCGIIYVPHRPYLLCIMAQTDEQTAQKEISAYSRMIYEFVTNASPAKNSKE